MKVEIIPAVLPRDYAELEDKLGLVKGFVKNVQVDICDGQFVPNATWPYRKSDDNFKKILNEEVGMPYWKDINYEFDLMVNQPQEVVEDWLKAGATRIIIHAESKGDFEAVFEKLGGVVEIGLALNIETALDVVEKYKERINFVQLMGIDRIGFQGQKFDDRVLVKISELKKLHPNLPISIDGGVSEQSINDLIQAGADRLVIGSAIFESDNPIDAVINFKKIAHR